MATGILSIAADNHHYRQDQRNHGCPGHARSGGARWSGGRRRSRQCARLWDLTDPDVTLRLFTFVAACAVLDSRLADHQGRVVLALGVVALVSWMVVERAHARAICRPARGRRCEIARTARGSWAASAPPVWRSWPPRWPGTHRSTGALAVAVPVWVTGCASMPDDLADPVARGRANDRTSTASSPIRGS